MKKFIIPALTLLVALPAAAKVTVMMPSNPTASITVVESPIGEVATGEPATIELRDGKGEYMQSPGASIITLSIDGQRLGTIFSAGPEENILVEIKEDGDPIITGTPLMDGITQLDLAVAPIDAEAAGLNELAATDPEAAQRKYEELSEKYYNVFKEYLAANPDAPAALYALLNLESSDFLAAYDKLSPAARESILMPLVERQKKHVEAEKEAEARIAKMQDGTFAAPLFSLPDTTGKIVNLADFRGKWVVLDFWGSWCRWCIKGFPDLKEAYKQYDGKMEVIGIDNRDTKEKWVEAVAKYELPWVNVYNDTESDAGMTLLQEYAVQGFPTKVVVGPDGIIRNITVGEDPNFYNVLRDLLK